MTPPWITPKRVDYVEKTYRGTQFAARIGLSCHVIGVLIDRTGRTEVDTLTELEQACTELLGSRHTEAPHA